MVDTNVTVNSTHFQPSNVQAIRDLLGNLEPMEIANLLQVVGKVYVEQFPTSNIHIGLGDNHKGQPVLHLIQVV